MNSNKFWKWKQQSIKNKDETETTESVLVLNGTIAEESWFDDEITPKLFKDELENHKGDITVWINSPGGDCIAAAQIYNMLISHKGNVTIKIDGIAASAASVIAMAGTKVLMSPVSMLMIHNPMTIAFGDKHQMKQAISMLDEVKESIMNAYEIKTGLSRQKLSNMMDSETWMNVHTAMELGFADDILQRTEKQDAPNVSMMYSEIRVVNSLKEKIISKTTIETKNDKHINADDLIDRLFLMKNWR
ncbi:head maturation protease, ClpP-related [Streptococcus suis]